jgi:RNA polymerase sigma-54 factor
MTPQLQQAIKLLALSNMEIESFIAEELERNPLLDSAAAMTAPRSRRRRKPSRRSHRSTGSSQRRARGRCRARHRHQQRGFPSGQRRGFDARDGLAALAWAARRGAERRRTAPTSTVSPAPTSPSRALLRQAGELLSGADLMIAAHLIELIEETGYITASLSEAAQRLGIPQARVEHVLGSSTHSIRRGSAPATWPNALPCRRATRTATIRRWRG